MDLTDKQVLTIILMDEVAKKEPGLHGRLLRRGIDWIDRRPGPKPPTVRSAPRGTWSDHDDKQDEG